MGQKLISYEINPYYFQSKYEVASLSFSEKSLLREVMDLCWMTEEKTSMPYDPSDLSDKTGLDSSEVDRIINKLWEEAGLVELTFEMGASSMILTVPYLVTQVNTLTEREESQKVLSVEDSMKKSNTVTPFKRVAGYREADDPIVGYLTEEEIANGSDQYSGWLPTAGFGTKGEVYYLRKGLIRTLQDHFPGRDIHQDIEDMFFHLIKEDAFRPTLPAMNRYMARWINRNQERGVQGGINAGNMETAFESLDESFSKLLESENFS